MHPLVILLPSFYLGWGLGSNDAANVFGANVASGGISYRRAALLAAIFVVLGAVLEGRKCFSTVGDMTTLDSASVFITTLTAAVVVNLMTWLRLPVSTSQAIMGALVGAGLALGHEVDFAAFGKVVVCWVFTPLGAAALAAVSYKLMALAFRRIANNLYAFHNLCVWGALITACYAAYNLGANNVANVTGPAVGAGLLRPGPAALIGAVCIVAGILTYGERVTETVGRGIAPLDPFSAWVVVLSQALALHVFTQIGVPVSSSQAVVGAVAGVGFVQSQSAVNRRTLALIGAGWVATVVVSAAGAFAFESLAVLCRLR